MAVGVLEDKSELGTLQFLTRCPGQRSEHHNRSSTRRWTRALPPARRGPWLHQQCRVRWHPRPTCRSGDSPCVHCHPCDLLPLCLKTGCKAGIAWC